MVIKNASVSPSWQNYLEKLYYNNRVWTYLTNYAKKDYDKAPTVYVSETCGSETAGQIWCNNNYIDIELSAWVLIDKKATQGVIRHELAHAISFMCGYEGTAHGKEFTRCLKIVSPKLFRRDRHWHDTQTLYLERRRYHPKTKLRGS